MNRDSWSKDGDPQSDWWDLATGDLDVIPDVADYQLACVGTVHVKLTDGRRFTIMVEETT